jgi:spermidine/putrescine transport system ATP-binding protein
VTHDQEEAMTMADTVAVMNAGRIEQMGAPAELYESPVTTFVANFLGQSNLISVRRTGSDLTGDQAAMTVDCHGQRLRVPTNRITSTGDEFFAGVRPEKIHLARRDDAATPNGLNRLVGGIVADASFTGVSTQYLVRMPWGQELTVFAQNLGVGERFPTGSAVDLTWEPSHTFGLAGDAAAGNELLADTAQNAG